ncbi:tail terminator [Vibrio phage phi 3]|uniref:Uncharacterized protein n=1 Tax=Vibrio phage phi 3 TaxID=1589298 RepID=A0A0B5H336_9CAUD|nr:tail terminator [Vibrio phage phi 3]AJF40902.1 hypothetical protein SBVP3_00135 [Vibrio phage phi 3]
MSRRISIRTSLVEKLKQELNGTGNYWTDIDGQVFGDQLFLSQIETFPAITVSAGSERPTYLPGGFRWLKSDYFIRVYVRNEDASAEELEKIIEDIKTFIDLNEEFEYDILKPGADSTSPIEKGTVTQVTLQEVTTDEGVLRPYAVGEILLTVLYDERSKRY